MFTSLADADFPKFLDDTASKPSCPFLILHIESTLGDFEPTCLASRRWSSSGRPLFAPLRTGLFRAPFVPLALCPSPLLPMADPDEAFFLFYSTEIPSHNRPPVASLDTPLALSWRFLLFFLPVQRLWPR